MGSRRVAANHLGQVEVKVDQRTPEINCGSPSRAFVQYSSDLMLRRAPRGFL
jgi:hypothetical protein